MSGDERSYPEPKESRRDCGHQVTNIVDHNSGRLVQACVVNGNIVMGDCSHDPQGSDTALLRAETEANLHLMAGHLSLPAPEGGVPVERALFPELVRAEEDFLLTGDPGIGKTALMCGLARHYRDRGHDVVLLDAGPFAGEISGKLARPLHTVLTEWTGEEPGHLLIDSLDGERGEALGWLSDIVARLDGTRWRVIASARLYDISNNERWKTAFKGAPVSSDPRHRVEELKGVRHFLADGFTEAELEDAASRIPGLGTVLAQAAPPFRELLANPFNLYLTCDLLAEGVWDQGIAEPSDQVVLLERYWGARVANGGGFDRIRLLKDVCSLMLERRRLQISAADLSPGHGEAVAELSGNGILRPIPSRYAHAVPSVAFTHHILFDYAVAQLVFVSGEGSVLAELLDAEPNLVFIARPAIDLHLAQTWDIDPTREEFARLFRRLVRSENVLVGVAAAAVVAARSRAEADIAWLTSEEALGDAEGIGLVIGVLGEDIGGEPRIRKRSVEIWTSLAVVLADRLDGDFHPRTVNLLQRILRTLDGLEPLSPDAVRAHERASCVAALMTTALEDTAGRARLAAAVSQSLPVAVAVDSGHGDLVRRIMHDPHTREHNPDVFYWCVVGAADIAHAAPAIAAELVETVWGLTGDRNEMTPLLTGVVSLSSNLEQDFTRVRYQVGEAFPRLIPLIGVEAACRVLATATREAYFTEAEKQCRYRLLAEGEEGLVLVGLASLRHSGGYGAAGTMTDALLDWAERAGVDGTHTTVRFLVRHVRHPDVWKRTMIRMRERVELWSTAALMLLSSGGLLANTVTRSGAAALLGAMSPKATNDEHRCLEEAVEAAAATAAPEGGPDRLRVLDELVPYLDWTRLTTPSLAERRKIVDHLDEPPEVSSWRITTGFRSLTPQEKFGEDVCAQLGPERLALVEQLDGLRMRSKAERDEAWLAELTGLLSEVLRDRSLMERMFPDRDDPAAEVVVGAARALAGSGGVAPETELGRRICEVFRQVIGSEPDREGESP